MSGFPNFSGLLVYWADESVRGAAVTRANAGKTSILLGNSRFPVLFKGFSYAVTLKIIAISVIICSSQIHMFPKQIHRTRAGYTC